VGGRILAHAAGAATESRCPRSDGPRQAAQMHGHLPLSAVRQSFSNRSSMRSQQMSGCTRARSGFDKRTSASMECAGGDRQSAFHKLDRDLSELSGLWDPHIQIEERYFSPEVAAQLIEPPEHVRLIKTFSEHSQKHNDPDYLVLPFILYNLPPGPCQAMSAGLPKEVTEKKRAISLPYPLPRLWMRISTRPRLIGPTGGSSHLSTFNPGHRASIPIVALSVHSEVALRPFWSWHLSTKGIDAREVSMIANMGFVSGLDFHLR
jgi:hypothetical protein